MEAQPTAPWRRAPSPHVEPRKQRGTLPRLRSKLSPGCPISFCPNFGTTLSRITPKSNADRSGGTGSSYCANAAPTPSPSAGGLYFDKSSANEAARESGSARPSDARIPAFVIAALSGAAADRARFALRLAGSEAPKRSRPRARGCRVVHRARCHAVGGFFGEVAGSRRSAPSPRPGTPPAAKPPPRSGP